MSEVIENTVATVAETVVAITTAALEAESNVTAVAPAVEAVVAPVVAAPKAPSKKSLATAIFDAKMVERSQGLFATNKEFRAAVLNEIVTKLEVSVASASTMYNQCKVDAEKADANVGLGRDPKVEKVKVSTGKRGRPAGSKNAPKEEVAAPAADAVVEPVAAATEITVTVADPAINAALMGSDTAAA